MSADLQIAGIAGIAKIENRKRKRTGDRRDRVIGKSKPTTEARRKPKSLTTKGTKEHKGGGVESRSFSKKAFVNGAPLRCATISTPPREAHVGDPGPAAQGRIFFLAYPALTPSARKRAFGPRWANLSSRLRRFIIGCHDSIAYLV
jgi:hypothetical protein